jgi:hypothetical protein
VLEASLAVAALVAGVTGAWSPCGLSVVETLAPTGYAGRLRTTLVACATFAGGAMAGGVVTFGGLAWLGAGLGAGSTPALLAATALAAAAAFGELRGRRIVPQVRRQVPESWRRVLPVPLAAGLYGVLLGLGFTTFILTFAVWALAGVSVAVGQPALGVLIGAAFGAGRALPVVALAPATETAAGARIHAAMAERPAIYRRLRLLDAAAMLACAGALLAAPAQAARPERGRPFELLPIAQVSAAPATDPSAGAAGLTWQRPGGSGVVRLAGGERTLPGRDPVLSGGSIAWRVGDSITFASAGDLVAESVESAPGADAYGFSDGWLVWRAPRPGGGRLLLARPRGQAAVAPRTLESVPARADVGRPVVDGARVVYHLAGANGSRIVLRDLALGTVTVIRRRERALLTNPTLAGDTLLHVSSTSDTQELLLGSLEGTDRLLYATAPTARRDAGREPGRRRHRHYRFIRGRYRAVAPPPPAPRPRRGSTVTLWTTALAPDAAYVTRLTTRGSRTSAAVLSVPR